MFESKSFLLLLLIIGASFWASCGDGTGTKIRSQTDTLATRVQKGVDNLGEKVDSLLNNNREENFVNEAVDANVREIATLKIGIQKGSKKIKGAATKMLSDHQKLGSTIRSYAKAKNLTIKEVNTAGLNKDLRTLDRGLDFDKAWTDKMVSDHEKTVAKFEKGEHRVGDPDLKKIISAALSTLQSHLDKCRELQKSLNK